MNGGSRHEHKWLSNIIKASRGLCHRFVHIAGFVSLSITQDKFLKSLASDAVCVLK